MSSTDYALPLIRTNPEERDCPHPSPLASRVQTKFECKRAISAVLRSILFLTSPISFIPLFRLVYFNDRHKAHDKK